MLCSLPFVCDRCGKVEMIPPEEICPDMETEHCDSCIMIESIDLRESQQMYAGAPHSPVTLLQSRTGIIGSKGLVAP